MRGRAEGAGRRGAPPSEGGGAPSITRTHSEEIFWKRGERRRRSAWIASRMSPLRVGGIFCRIRWLSSPFVVDHCVCTYLRGERGKEGG